MKTPRIVVLLLLFTDITRAQAQDNPATAPAPAPAQTELQKWIATTDGQWQAAFKRDVTDVRETEFNKVKPQFLTTLDDAIKRASAAGDLKGALALRAEQKRFGDTQILPEEDEAGDAARLKAIRAAFRAQLAQLETKNTARAKALHAKYDQVLAQAQTQLTQSQRLDDALLVQTKRDEVAVAWLGWIRPADGQTDQSVPTEALAKVLTPEQLQIANGLHIGKIVLPTRTGLTYFHLDTKIDNRSPLGRIEKQVTIEVQVLCVDRNGKLNVTRFSKPLDIATKGPQLVGLGGVVLLGTIRTRNNDSEIPKNARVVFKIGGVTFHEAFLSPPGKDKWWLKDDLVVH